MESEHFDISTDAARCLLSVTMRGHWTLDTVEAYKKGVLSAVSGMLAAGCQRGEVLAFVDARDLSAQSQDAVADYKASMDRVGLLPKRLATLVSSVLFKRQVERIAIPNQRLFSDEAAALTWLTSPDSEH